MKLRAPITGDDLAVHFTILEKFSRPGFSKGFSKGKKISLRIGNDMEIGLVLPRLISELCSNFIYSCIFYTIVDKDRGIYILWTGNWDRYFDSPLMETELNRLKRNEIFLRCRMSLQHYLILISQLIFAAFALRFLSFMPKSRDKHHFVTRPILYALT